MRAQLRAWRPAFSLVELVLVLATIAVLSVVALPRYAASLTRYRLEAAARRIAADLAMAQASARATSTSQSVAFDVARSSYRVPGVSDPRRPSSPYAVDLTAEPYRCVLVSALFGPDSTLTFDGYGLPHSGGVITVRVGSLQRSLRVEQGTGAVAVLP